jgi:hypothetical protein
LVYNIIVLSFSRHFFHGLLTVFAWAEEVLCCRIKETRRKVTSQQQSEFPNSFCKEKKETFLHKGNYDVVTTGCGGGGGTPLLEGFLKVMARKALYPHKHKQPVSTIFRIVHLRHSFLLGTVPGTTHLPLAKVHYEPTKDKYYPAYVYLLHMLISFCILWHIIIFKKLTFFASTLSVDKKPQNTTMLAAWWALLVEWPIYF